MEGAQGFPRAARRGRRSGARRARSRRSRCPAATALSKDAPPRVRKRSPSGSKALESSGAARRRIPMAWVAIFVALALGFTIGGVLLSKVEKQEVVKYVEVPGSAKVAEAPVGGDTVLEEQAVAGGGTKHSAASPRQSPSRALRLRRGHSPGFERAQRLERPGATQGPDTAAQGPAPGRSARRHLHSALGCQASRPAYAAVAGTTRSRLACARRTQLGSRRRDHHHRAFGQRVRRTNGRRSEGLPRPRALHRILGARLALPQVRRHHDGERAVRVCAAQ